MFEIVTLFEWKVNREKGSLDKTYKMLYIYTYEATMETKLTLKLERDVIESAKKYAEKNNKSLSRLVEDFFRNMVYENNSSVKYPPLIEKLSGVISEKDLEKLSQEDEKARYILRIDR